MVFMIYHVIYTLRKESSYLIGLQFLQDSFVNKLEKIGVPWVVELLSAQDRSTKTISTANFPLYHM